jgi:hypothetical protein
VGGWFLAAEAKLVSRAARFGGGLWRWLGGWFGGMAAQIKVRSMRRKRYKSPSYVLDRRIVFSFADRDGSAPLVR